VGGLPDRRVVHVEIRADSADHYLARLEPHTDLDQNPMAPEHALRVALHRLLHAEGGVAGAHATILVGERGAEQGHDPVAHHLVNTTVS
jgi:hypothetical protein